MNVMNAPKVTISPCEKFDRPVVPKMSDSPIEVMPMIIASFSPLASVCGSRLHLLWMSRVSSPRKNDPGDVLIPGHLDFLDVLAFGHGQSPPGRVDTSSRTVKVPVWSRPMK